MDMLKAVIIGVIATALVGRDPVGSPPWIEAPFNLLVEARP